jgi:outer membrane immunogenic protein
VKSFILIAAATAAALAGPVAAQTTDTDNAFTGPRIEVHGGVDRIHGKERVNDGVTTVTAGRHDTNGFFGGQIGYDYAIRGSTVVGVFASYDLSNNKVCDSAGSISSCLKAHRNIEGGARIGEVLGGKTLVYVKGAYVNGRFGADASNLTTGAFASATSKRDGWRAGAGVEEALSRHAYVKAEYNYSRYNRFDGDLGAEDVSLRLNRQEALAGVGLRF